MTDVITKGSTIVLGRISRSVYIMDRSDMTRNNQILVLVSGELLYHPFINEIVVHYIMDIDHTTGFYRIRDIYEKIIAHDGSSTSIIAEFNYPEVVDVFNLHVIYKTPIITPDGRSEIAEGMTEYFIQKKYTLQELVRGNVKIHEIQRNANAVSFGLDSFSFFLHASLLINMPIPLLYSGKFIYTRGGDFDIPEGLDAIVNTASLGKDFESIMLLMNVYFHRNPEAKFVLFDFKPFQIEARCCFNGGYRSVVKLGLGDILNNIRNMIDQYSMYHYKTPE